MKAAKANSSKAGSLPGKVIPLQSKASSSTGDEMSSSVITQPRHLEPQDLQSPLSALTTQRELHESTVLYETSQPRHYNLT